MFLLALTAAASLNLPSAAGAKAAQACGGQVSISQSFVTAHVGCPAPAGGRSPLDLKAPLSAKQASDYFDRWSGISTEAATLQMAKGPVRDGGELMRIQARQAYGGVLGSDFDARGPLNLGGSSLFPAGTPVFGVAGASRMRGDMFVWCAISQRETGVKSGRAVCFSDSSRTVTIPLAFVPVKMKEPQAVFASSAKDSPFAPREMTMKLNKGGKKPTVTPTGRPYPAEFPIVLRLEHADDKAVTLAAEIDEPSHPFARLVVKRGPDGAAEFEAFGGRFQLTTSAEGATLRSLGSPADDVMVTFRPGPSL